MLVAVLADATLVSLPPVAPSTVVLPLATPPLAVSPSGFLPSAVLLTGPNPRNGRRVGGRRQALATRNGSAWRVHDDRGLGGNVTCVSRGRR